jgi:hypothetical protein
VAEANQHGLKLIMLFKPHFVKPDLAPAPRCPESRNYSK